jgi:hypothetical protein
LAGILAQLGFDHRSVDLVCLGAVNRAGTAENFAHHYLLADGAFGVLFSVLLSLWRRSKQNFFAGYRQLLEESHALRALPQ